MKVTNLLMDFNRILTAAAANMFASFLTCTFCTALGDHFFSTLGDQCFLNMQRRGNRLGTFGHHRRHSRKIGKRREASVNPWELSRNVGNLHFERFFTRFRHEICQIWSYRGIHSTNRCEISRSFIWKGSWGLVFSKIYAFCQNTFNLYHF